MTIMLKVEKPIFMDERTTYTTGQEIEVTEQNYPLLATYLCAGRVSYDPATAAEQAKATARYRLAFPSTPQERAEAAEAAAEPYRVHNAAYWANDNLARARQEAKQAEAKAFTAEQSAKRGRLSQAAADEAHARADKAAQAVKVAEAEAAEAAARAEAFRVAAALKAGVPVK